MSRKSAFLCALGGVALTFAALAPILFPEFWRTNFHYTWFRHYTIKIVLPNNYRGFFSIREDREYGTPPEIRGRDIFFIIPASGHLVTSDEMPLKTPHQPTVCYEDGQHLRSFYENENTSDNTSPGYYDFGELSPPVEGDA